MSATMLQREPTTPRPRLYDFAEGFGSVYGRYVRNHLCRRLIAQHDIRSVLEAPCNAESYFASPGTQSVVFAEAGCAVTLLHPEPEIVGRTRAFWDALGLPETVVLQHTDLYHLPFESGQFDLVWNFDSLPLLDDPMRAVAELARVSRRLVMVIVPNALNIGYPLHALLNRLHHRSSAWGERHWMATPPVVRAMQAAGLQISEAGLVDMPPWPGFDALNLLGRLVRRTTVEAYDDQRTDEQVERMLRRLTLIEYAPVPMPLQTPLAHQRYVIGRKELRS